MKNTQTIQLAIGPGTLAILLLVCVALGVLVAPSRSVQDPTTGLNDYAMPSGASADSNNRMIAVTGVDRTGASVLYLVDTEAKQLAVYQATGGTSSKMGVKLLALVDWIWTSSSLDSTTNLITLIVNCRTSSPILPRASNSPQTPVPDSRAERRYF